jgi:hypothetical protein
MSISKRNILFKFLIILISLSMFGFQDLPVKVDPVPTMDQPVPDGWVELLVYGEAPNEVVDVIEDPVHFFLPITSIDSQGRSEFQAISYTYGHGKGNRGPITVEVGFPVVWIIRGHVNLPPDCGIEMTIDEAWFPGYSITCEPYGIVGCLEDTWPSDFFIGTEFKIPFNRAWGSPVPSIGSQGIPIHLTVIVESIAIGDLTGGIQPLGCESFLWYPVIPQAQ